jgi:hypothetical protein
VVYEKECVGVDFEELNYRAVAILSVGYRNLSLNKECRENWARTQLSYYLKLYCRNRLYSFEKEGDVTYYGAGV